MGNDHLGLPSPAFDREPKSKLLRFWFRLIRFGFRLFYNEFAWTYDGVSYAVSLGHWQDWQQAALPFIHGDQILELAHGPGHIQLALHTNGFDPVGIDLSPHMMKQASKRIRQGGFEPQLVRGRVQDLPFQDDFFDTILATFPTDFIIDARTLGNVHRILRPEGRLIVVAEGRLLGSSPIHRLIEWMFRVTGQRKIPKDGEEEPSIWMEVDRRLAAAGFIPNLKAVRSPHSEVTVVVADKD